MALIALQLVQQDCSCFSELTELQSSSAPSPDRNVVRRLCLPDNAFWLSRAIGQMTISSFLVGCLHCKDFTNVKFI